MAADCIVVVPCYNEATRLDVSAFLRFARATADVRFLFVDDGSTDGTGRVLARLREERPEQFDTLRLPRNEGKGEAVRQGMVAALGSGARCVGYWDADLATPLHAIHSFRGILERSPWLELVMGSRVQLLGRRIERRARRHYLGRVFATCASIALGLRVYDTQCGAKLFRATPAIASIFEKPFRSRWIFDVEILARLVTALRAAPLTAVAVVHEEPLAEWADIAGSRLRVRNFIGAFFDLARIGFERMSSSRTRVREAADIATDAGLSSQAQAQANNRTAEERETSNVNVG
ncbi:MAG: glycosyltransferase [Longimicrobiales bacterium]